MKRLLEPEGRSTAKSVCDFAAPRGCRAAACLLLLLGIELWPITGSANSRTSEALTEGFHAQASIGMRTFCAPKNPASAMSGRYCCTFRWPFQPAGKGVLMSTFTCNRGDAIGVDYAVDCPSFRVSFKGQELGRDRTGLESKWSDWIEPFQFGKDDPYYQATTAACP